MTLTINGKFWTRFISALAERGWALPNDWVSDDNGVFTATWDVTPPNGQEIRDLASSVRTGIDYDLYVQIDNQIPILRAYMQTSSPTNAQSVMAIKSIIKVLRSMIRD